MQNLRENVLQLHKLRANWAEKSAEIGDKLPESCA